MVRIIKLAIKMKGRFLYIKCSGFYIDNTICVYHANISYNVSFYNCQMTQGLKFCERHLKCTVSFQSNFKMTKVALFEFLKIITFIYRYCDPYTSVYLLGGGYVEWDD